MANKKILIDLDVNGDITGDSFIKDGGASTEFLKADGSVDTNTYLTSTDVDDLVDGSGTANYITKWTDADTIGDSIIFDNGTNVGIGTTSPVEKLQINSGDVLINNSSISTLKSGGSLYLDLNTFGDLGGRNFRVQNNGNVHLNIDSSGNVGIGTTSPSEKLDVVGRVRASYDTSNYYEIGASSAGGFVVGKSGGVETVNIRTYGNSHFNGGNVGIGTTSPNRSLHVIGQVAIDNSTSPSGGLLVSPDGTSNKVYSRTGNATSSAHPLDFISGSSTSMRIATNGNVGIGTTSPLGKLQVNEYTVASQGAQSRSRRVKCFCK